MTGTHRCPPAGCFCFCYLRDRAPLIASRTPSNSPKKPLYAPRKAAIWLHSPAQAQFIQSWIQSGPERPFTVSLAKCTWLNSNNAGAAPASIPGVPACLVPELGHSFVCTPFERRSAKSQTAIERLQATTSVEFGSKLAIMLGVLRTK